MSAESMEIWKNVVLSIIPNIILLVAGIMILRKVRNWYTIVLIVAAAFNIVLPIASQSLSRSYMNDVKSANAAISALPTQQEKEAVVQRETPRLKQAEIYLKWLNDGRYVSMLAFAIMLTIAVGMFVPKTVAVPSQTAGAAMDKSAAP